MDQYTKSLQDVDAALSRLNATLASYKINPMSKPQIPTEPLASAEPGPTAASTEIQTGRRWSMVEHRMNIDGTRWPLRVLEPAGTASSRVKLVDLQLPDQNPTQACAMLEARGSWQEVLDLRATHTFSQVSKEQLIDACNCIPDLVGLRDHHFCCMPLYLVLAQKYLQLGYPDLASAEAYKALLLSDAIQDTSDENHHEACEGIRRIIQHQPLVERITLLKTELHADADAKHRRPSDPDEETDVEVDVWLREHYLLITYRLLSRSLVLCGCYRSAWECITRAHKLYSTDKELGDIAYWIRAYVATTVGLAQDKPGQPWVSPTTEHGWDRVLDEGGYRDPATWPDSGMVRREVYPWNPFESDRLEELDTLNAIMAQVAPKLEVRAVELPAFPREYPYPQDLKVVTQLGVFAKEDLAPGEVILNEMSILTANNKLQDALCDACSADLPDINGPDAGSIVGCPDCDVVFCKDSCYDLAMEFYHPALCGYEVESIAKDVEPSEAADSLYALLLLRILAMSKHQDCHPLELTEVKHIWGDFHGLPFEQHWSPSGSDLDGVAKTLHHGFPRTLPFSFEHNVRLPFHMLEKMDIDIFCNPQYDLWVFNTLYAKFRGTASARLSGRGGSAIRGPEVSAVHPLWCLANHSCDPNVSWDWDASIKFTVKESRVNWDSSGDGGALNGNKKQVRSKAGIKKDEEILNHYCDIELPVKQRREWAKGSLGGDCMCARCVYEASGEEDQVENGNSKRESGGQK